MYFHHWKSKKKLENFSISAWQFYRMIKNKRTSIWNWHLKHRTFYAIFFRCETKCLSKHTVTFFIWCHIFNARYCKNLNAVNCEVHRRVHREKKMGNWGEDCHVWTPEKFLICTWIKIFSLSKFSLVFFGHFCWKAY